MYCTAAAAAAAAAAIPHAAAMAAPAYQPATVGMASSRDTVLDDETEPMPELTSVKGEDAVEKRPRRGTKQTAGLAGALAGLLALKTGDVSPALNAELAAAETVEEDLQASVEPIKRVLKRERDSKPDNGFSRPAPKAPTRARSVGAFNQPPIQVMPTLKLTTAENAAEAPLWEVSAPPRPESAPVWALSAPALIACAEASASTSATMNTMLQCSSVATFPPDFVACSNAPLYMPGVSSFLLHPPMSAPASTSAATALSSLDIGVHDNLAGLNGSEMSSSLMQQLRTLAERGMGGSPMPPELVQSLTIALKMCNSSDQLHELPPHPMSIPLQSLKTPFVGAMFPPKPQALPPVALPPPSRAALSAQGSLSGTEMGSVETSTYDGTASHEVSTHQGNGSECCSDLGHEHHLTSASNMPMRPHSTPPELLVRCHSGCPCRICIDTSGKRCIALYDFG